MSAVPSDYNPPRVVCLQPSATVILAAIGRLDRVVACTQYCADVCPEVNSGGRSIIADSWTAQSQQILAARPDLVIAAVPYQEKAVVEILKAGVRFLGLSPKTLADIYVDIATIAGVVGASARGQEVIANMQREIATVQQQVNGKKHPRVFCEEWGKPLIASQKWVADLVDAAGGEFVGDPGDNRRRNRFWRSIRRWSLPHGVAPATAFLWRRSSATGNGNRCMPCEKGRVYCISDELLNTPAPTLSVGCGRWRRRFIPVLFHNPKG